MRRTKRSRQTTPTARIGRCNRELKPKVHTVKGVHTFFLCPHPAAAPRLACRPHKVHTLAYTFWPLFCVYISVCIIYAGKCNVHIKKVHTLAYAYRLCTAAGKICEKVHTYTDSLSYRFCVYLYPLFFLLLFIFLKKKVHTLAGH